MVEALFLTSRWFTDGTVSVNLHILQDIKLQMIIPIIQRRGWIQKSLYLAGLCIVFIILVRLYQLLKFHNPPRTLSCFRCNVVVLDLDILRADELRCFGRGVNITPNICRLIRQSTYFSNNFSQSNWTLSSSLSTYTSLYPNVHQVWAQEQGMLAPSTMTLAVFLQQMGYLTYYSGFDDDALLTERNGGLRGYSYIDLTNPGPTQWLDTYKTMLTHSSAVFFHVYNGGMHIPYLLGSSEQPLQDLPKPEGLPLRVTEYAPIRARYVAEHYQEIFTSETIAKNPAIFQADPSIREQRIADYFNTLEDQHDYTQRLYARDTFFNSYMQFIDTDNPRDTSYLHMLYQTRLHTLDSELAEFINYLLQPDVASHTMVILTSAHGEAFGEHGTFAHGNVPYNELYHVPLVIKYPTGKGKRVDAVVENIDVYPTIVQMVIGRLPQNIQGVSLIPLLSGVSNQAKSYAVSINDNNAFVIQTKQYALVVYKDHTKPTELYDLIADPGELHNIAAENPQIVNNYFQLLITSAAPELQLGKLRTPIPSGVDRQKLIKGGYF